MRVFLMIISGSIIVYGAITTNPTVILASMIPSGVGLALHIRRQLQIEREQQAHVEWLVRDIVPTEEEVRQNRARAMRLRVSERESWRR